MSLCSAEQLTRVLTWGTLSGALSSALWLSAAGDDNYPLHGGFDELFGAPPSSVAGPSVGQSAAERARTVSRALPERSPGLR